MFLYFQKDFYKASWSTVLCWEVDCIMDSKVIIMDLKENNVVVRGLICDNAVTNVATLNPWGWGILTKDLSLDSFIARHVDDHVTLLRCICHLDLILKEYNLKPVIKALAIFIKHVVECAIPDGSLLLRLWMNCKLLKSYQKIY